jgi:arylsulfatase
VLRRQRLANAKRLGLLSKGVEGVPRAEGVPAWDELSLEQQKIEARKMEVYAAMIESLDDNLGRLVDYLKSINEFDNTFIVFLSDNGPEGADRSKLRGNDVWIPKTFDNSYNNMGRVNSYIYPGVAWAQVSAAPLRLYKSFVSEGGIRVPAFVSYRGVKQKGSIHSGFLSVMDIAPTLVELAGAEPPSTHYNGLKIHPFKGTSMLAFLSGKSQFIHRQDYVMGWELFGHRAIRQGDWKLLWLSSKPSWLTLSGTTDQWGLYNLSTDPAEMNDLSGSEPEKFAEMKAYWHQYVRDNNVVLPQWGSR